MMPNLTTRLLNCEDETKRAFLDKQLRTYNDEQSHWHRDIRTSGGETFDIYTETPDGDIVAGLYGEVYWEALEIDRLWVAEQHRHQGLGLTLIQAAEQHAIVKQCRFIHLTTFSFQAPAFYQKAGYQVVGQMHDMPPGFSKVWLRKDLT